MQTMTKTTSSSSSTPTPTPITMNNVASPAAIELTVLFVVDNCDDVCALSLVGVCDDSIVVAVERIVVAVSDTVAVGDGVFDDDVTELVCVVVDCGV